jgi:regulator of sigma E protease
MLQNLGYTALLLGVLIVVHEFGHFIVAKLCGVKVLRFSVGFGPKLLGFQWGETEYRLAALPLGGYVKMAGELPGEEVAPEDVGRGFLAQPWWGRALIAAAGPVFNLVFPIAVYVLAFSLYAQPSSRVMSLEPGFPAERAGLQLGDRIVAVDGDAVGSLEELRHRMEGNYDRPVSVSADRDGRRLDFTVTPLRVMDDSGSPVRSPARGMLGISAAAEPALVGVPEGSPAYVAGLRTFDRVISVNGRAVKDALELNEALAQDKASTLKVGVLRFEALPLPGTTAKSPVSVTLDVPRQAGEGMAALGVERADLYLAGVATDSPAAKAGLVAGDRLVSLNGQALPSYPYFQVLLDPLGAKPFQLAWRHGTELHQATVARAELGEGRPVLGVTPYLATLDFEGSTDKVKVSPGTALRVAVWKMEAVIAETVVGFKMLLMHRVPFNSVGGPIFIYQLASKSAQAGAESFLQLMAVISVSLGVMNLVPIPVLDGFQLLTSLWEGIRRRPISLRVREVANMVGLAMLLALMLAVFTNDLTR